MFEELSAPRSLGLYDPLSVAWELVPFSFVADWFIPIGTYLDNLAAIPNISALTWVCNIRFYSGSGIGYSVDASGNNYKGSRTNKSSITFSRSPYSLDTANVFPEFKKLPDALSSGHIKNAVALLHQIFT